MSAMTSAAPPAGARRGYPLIAAAPPLIAAVVTAAVSAAVWSRLPDRVATHVGGTGEPDGFAHPAVLVTVSVLLLAGWGAGGAWLAGTARVPARALYCGALAPAVLLGYLSPALLLANAAADQAADVRFPMWHLAIAAGAALAAAALALVLPTRPAPEGERGDGAAPRTSTLGLRPGERVVWQRTVHSWPLTALQGAMVIAAVLIAAVGGDTGVWIVLLVVAVILALTTRVRVSAGEFGLALRPALLGVPRLGVPLDRIAAAEVRPTSPLKDLGGWGYRITAGRRGFAVRSGDGLWLELTDGKQYVVVVDDARTAAALLNDLIARRSAHSEG